MGSEGGGRGAKGRRGGNGRGWGGRRGEWGANWGGYRGEIWEWGIEPFDWLRVLSVTEKGGIGVDWTAPLPITAHSGCLCLIGHSSPPMNRDGGQRARRALPLAERRRPSGNTGADWLSRPKRRGRAGRAVEGGGEERRGRSGPGRAPLPPPWRTECTVRPSGPLPGGRGVRRPRFGGGEREGGGGECGVSRDSAAPSPGKGERSRDGAAAIRAGGGGVGGHAPLAH